MKPVLLGYFVRRLGTAILLLWIAISALLLFFEFLRAAEDNPFFKALLLALLKSPQIAMETLPFTCAIGSTLAIRRMVQDGEMPTLRTAGLSPIKILSFQLIAALPFVFLYIGLSEVLLPHSADITRTMKNKISEIHGLWLREQDDYIHIKRIDNSGVMSSIIIYHTENTQLTGITHAARATYDKESWVLHDVKHTDSRSSTLSKHQQQKIAWELPLQPTSFSAFTQKPREMALYKAIRTANELAAAGQHNNDFQKTIWRRWLTLPALLLLTCISIGFIGSNRQQRYAISLPVILTTLIAAIYYIFRDIFIQIASISDSFSILILPPLIFSLYIAYSTRRAAAI